MLSTPLLGSGMEEHSNGGYQSHFDVVIIGGGISGLAASRYFADKGINHCLLEASGRIGGRMFTVPFAETQIDLGVSYIDGGVGTPFYDLAIQEGLTLHRINDDSENGVVIYHTGELARHPPCDNTLEKTESWVAEFLAYVGQEASRAWSDKKIGSFLDKFANKKEFSPLQRVYFEYILFAMFEANLSASVDDMSMWNLDGLNAMKSEQYIIEQGFSALIPSLTQGVNLRLNRQVRQITHSKDGVNIETENGETFSCRKVLLSVPLGVLKSDQIKFSPKLPSKRRDAIKMFETTPDITVYLQFPEVFWDSSCSWIGAISSEREDSIFFLNLAQVFNQPVLMANLHPKKAESLKSEEVISSILMDALRVKYPCCPTPTRVLTSKWSDNPNYRGAGSYISKADTEAHPAKLLQKSVEDRIFFSGEAFSVQDNCTPLGAHKSGLEAAKSIHQSLC